MASQGVRACVLHGAGDLRIEERPAARPGANQVAVDIALGGICGSDLHYYHDGAVGDFQVREPLVLGHEVAGHVAELGQGVKSPPVGAPVVIHPATPCGECRECAEGRLNLCGQTAYLGSAARVPHVQGGLVERLIIPADQVRAVPNGLDLRRAVLAEPLSVAVHAVRRAGEVKQRRVLVTGAGPIGCMIAAVLSHAGASEVVISDILDEPLRLAAELGATTVRSDQLDDPAWPYEAEVAIEAAGVPAALGSCVRRVRRGGTVVLCGMLPAAGVEYPANLVVVRELTLTGSFRFDTEFDESLAMLAEGLDIDSLVTHTFPLARAREAFDLAGNRSEASKVLLDLSTD